MSLQKHNAHKLTVKRARGSSNNRHESNKIRGTLTIISTVFTYFVQQQHNLAAYLCQSRIGIVEAAVKHRIRATPSKFMRDA
jgi:hypothetical protein